MAQWMEDGNDAVFGWEGLAWEEAPSGRSTREGSTGVRRRGWGRNQVRWQSSQSGGYVDDVINVSRGVTLTRPFTEDL